MAKVLEMLISRTTISKIAIRIIKIPMVALVRKHIRKRRSMLCWQTKSGKVSKLLLSGDYQSDDYNEVGAMRRYALESGIPDEDILLDYSGFSTYETVSRAKKLFGIDRAVIVTQRYHLYRALHIARSFGMDAVGADAALRGYRGQIFRNMREILALDKDFLLCIFDFGG